jgi:hypothetical protein
MDEGTVEYLRALAETLYNDALEFDKLGEEGIATVFLDLAISVQIALSEAGRRVFYDRNRVRRPR